MLKTITVGGCSVPMCSDDGINWQRVDIRGEPTYKTNLQFNPLPCVASTLSGRPQGAMNRQSMRGRGGISYAKRGRQANAYTLMNNGAWMVIPREQTYKKKWKKAHL